MQHSATDTTANWLHPQGADGRGEGRVKSGLEGGEGRFCSPKELCPEKPKTRLQLGTCQQTQRQKQFLRGLKFKLERV